MVTVVLILLIGSVARLAAVEKIILGTDKGEGGRSALKCAEKHAAGWKMQCQI